MIEVTSSLNDNNHDVIVFNGEAFTYLDCGNTRRVLVNSDKSKVIKELIDSDAYDYNLEEIEVYENAKDKSRMAFTEISKDGKYIIQEYVSPIETHEDELTIPMIKFASSCRDEVGWTKDGRLVCFDLDEYEKY